MFFYSIQGKVSGKGFAEYRRFLEKLNAGLMLMLRYKKMTEKRISEEEKAEILRIAGVESIRGATVSWEQAEEIANVLGEVERMKNAAWLKEKGPIDLNCWINTLRFYRIEIDAVAQHAKHLKEKQLEGWAQHAKNIASSTLNNAVTEEDRARGQREMNAATALGNGDISGAFRSLNYFQDR